MVSSINRSLERVLPFRPRPNFIARGLAAEPHDALGMLRGIYLLAATDQALRTASLDRLTQCVAFSS
jgi:hypothetical protein